MAASKTITWNGVASTTISGLVIGQVTRSLVGEVQGTHVKIPGKPGSTYFPQSRGRRTISVDCFVEASTAAARRTAVDAVAAWLDVEVQAELYISDEAGVYYEAVLETSPDVDEWREFGVFTLVWKVNPYALDTNVDTESWTSGVNTTHNWDPGLDVWVEPIIEITPTNGTLTGFTLTANTDYVMSWTGLVADDDTLTINGIAKVVLGAPNSDVDLTGTFDLNDLVLSGFLGKFPILIAPGVNTITFLKLSGTATSFDIVVTYRKRYRR